MGYIEIAKCLKPSLTEEACEMIGEEYAKLRSQDFENSDVARTQPVTARCLETLIRLSTAHAKARLSKTVDAVDAETAIELVQFAYFKKVLAKDKKKRRHDDSEGEEEEDIDENTNPEDDSVPEPKRAKKDVTPPREGPVEINVVRLEQFKTALFGIFESTRQQNLPMDDVRAHIVGVKKFSEGEMMAAIEKMT